MHSWVLRMVKKCKYLLNWKFLEDFLIINIHKIRIISGLYSIFYLYFVRVSNIGSYYFHVVSKLCYAIEDQNYSC